MLTVIARYRARPGQADAVAAVLAQHVAATRAEPGCVQFDATRSSEDPDQFVLYEKYLDEDAFQVHRASPHFQRFVLEEVVPRLAERSWQRYAQIG